MKKIIFITILCMLNMGCKDNKPTENNQTALSENITGEYNDIDHDGFLNLRKQPQSGAAIIRQIPAGEKFVVLETTNPGWTKIKTQNNEVGFVSTNRIKILTPNNETANPKSPYHYLPGNFSCDFNKILSDQNTPTLAKNLYHHSATYSEEPIEYFSCLSSPDKQERAFYFRVITNSYRMADGAYSEILGVTGKGFIESCPQEFASFFDNNTCFKEEDLKIWVSIVMLEFAIVDEGSNTDGVDSEAMLFIEMLQAACEDYPQSQQATIHKFCNILKADWAEYFKE